MSGAHGVKKKKDVQETGPPPPDGGWGWMVVFGSFMIHIITDGVTYSFGVFYDEFLDYFQEGKGATSWILSILVGVTLCSGPISSSFVNRWGCRPVTIAGSILASICLVISFWAKSVTVLYFTIGIGTGLGFGLIYLPAIVSVTTYFEKKRSLATGIAVCGSGFGTFVFAPIITMLLDAYGWRGALLIIAAIVLECILFGALFRPLEYKKTRVPLEMRDLGDDCIPLKSADGTLDMHSTPIYTNHYLCAGNSNIHRPRSMGHVAIFPLTKPEKNGNSINYGALEKSDIARLALSQPMLTQSAQHYDHFKRKGSIKGPLYRPDVFYQGSLLNIPSYKSQSNLRNGEVDELMERPPSSTHKDQLSDDEDAVVCGFVPCSRETKDTLYTMLDFSLFKDIIFILFTLSNFLTSIGFNVPYVYIVSRAKELGISPEDAALLLSVIGIANTIGRIILGYISDKTWVNRLWVYNSCLTICGIATALSAFCTDFYTLAFYAAVFGFTIGAYVGLTSVILVDLLGLDKLTNAFGLLLLFQGIASLVGPPIAGGLYDALGSYDPGFYLAGTAIALSGLMLFCIPTVQKWQHNKQSRTSHSDNI